MMIMYKGNKQKPKNNLSEEHRDSRPKYDILISSLEDVGL